MTKPLLPRVRDDLQALLRHPALECCDEEDYIVENAKVTLTELDAWLASVPIEPVKPEPVEVDSIKDYVCPALMSEYTDNFNVYLDKLAEMLNEATQEE